MHDTLKSVRKIESKPVKIKWLTKCSTMNQMYSSGLEYCFISKDNKQCCPFVFCKDFLQDALMAALNKCNISIYGFLYDPINCEPIYLEKTKIALGNSSDKNFMEKIPNVLDFINQIERELRLIRSRVQVVENTPKKYSKSGVVIMESSNRWILSPPMISLYSLLIRVGFAHKKGISYKDTIQGVINKEIPSYQKEDASQLSAAKAGLDKILNNGYAKIFYKDQIRNFPKISTSAMHDGMGIVSFSNGHSQNHVKYWHRDLTKKKKTSS